MLYDDVKMIQNPLYISATYQKSMIFITVGFKRLFYFYQLPVKISIRSLFIYK